MEVPDTRCDALETWELNKTTQMSEAGRSRTRYRSQLGVLKSVLTYDNLV